MPNCSIMNCRNATNNGTDNRDISYFRFPNDPKIKKKWIEATGSKNWMPTKNSAICSIHFHEDTFTSLSKYRRVIRTACPTIDVLKRSNGSDDEKESNINQPSTSKSKHPNTSIYSTFGNAELLTRKLARAHEIIKEHKRKIKRLQSQNRRKDIKIQTLVNLLVSLKKAILNKGGEGEEDGDIEGISDLGEDKDVEMSDSGEDDDEDIKLEDSDDEGDGDVKAE